MDCSAMTIYVWILTQYIDDKVILCTGTYESVALKDTELLLVSRGVFFQ